MALSARLPDASDLVSLCRHKLEGIFDMHGVKTGSRADVLGFLEKLHNDRYFAMDFWALVEWLEGMGNQISDEQIRRIVAECVCGWVPNDDLAMAGIHEEFDARGLGRSAQDGPRVTDVQREAGLRIVEHDPDSMAVEPDRAAGEDIVASGFERRDSQREPPVVELGSGVGSGAAGRIDQILTRLELNDHELKLLLESIESRISRLEPHVEELTSQVVKSRNLEAKAESTGGVKKDRWAGTAATTTAWFGRQRAAVKNGATATHVLVSQGMKSADLRFAKMMKGTAAAATEFDGAIARTLNTLPSKHALRRARRLAMLRASRGQMALMSLGSRLMKSLGHGAVNGRAIAADAIAAAHSFERKFSLETAPEMFRLMRRRGMLSNVAKGLSVGVSLWLVIWLWGRPQADFSKAAPAAASTTAASPVTQEKPADAQAADDASTGVQGGSVDGTANVSADRVADGTAAGPSTGGVRRVASQVTAGKGRDYTAPPWTKWYGATDGTKSQGASGQPAKSAGR
jgi:hypothetical protein